MNVFIVHNTGYRSGRGGGRVSDCLIHCVEYNILIIIDLQTRKRMGRGSVCFLLLPVKVMYK